MLCQYSCRWDWYILIFIFELRQFAFIGFVSRQTVTVDRRFKLSHDWEYRIGWEIKCLMFGRTQDVACIVGSALNKRLPLKCGLRVNIPGLHSVKQNLAFWMVYCKSVSCYFKLESSRYTCTWCSLWKHAYSNILKISPPKTESFQIKIWYFFTFLLKT